MVASLSFDTTAFLPAPESDVQLRVAPEPRPSRHKMAWTEREKDELRMMWGHHRVADIARRLDRKPAAVYRMAGALDLGLGCPQGFEYVAEASRRAGYAHATMVAILRWAGVKLWMPSSDPSARGTNPERVVEPSEVDEAVRAWCATETLAWAADRHGITPRLMARILKAAHARWDSVQREHAERKHWRLHVADVDRAMAIYRAGEALKPAVRTYPPPVQLTFRVIDQVIETRDRFMPVDATTEAAA